LQWTQVLQNVTVMIDH